MIQWRRGVATAAVLAVIAAGTGLPMCASLLARAAEPCAMHQHERGGHEAHGPQVAPGHDRDDACHAGDGDVGCATGGSCPTGGTAGPASPAAALAAGAPVRSVPAAIDQSYRSFLTPPPPPPPQA